MMVSIIIPVYNAEKYLKDTLNSACQQSYLNFEAIIIDDFSTDNSWDIACEFCKKDSRFKAYRNIRKGAAAARNYGFSLSKGDFIQYLDADDILHPDKIQIQLNYISNHDLGNDKLLGCQWQFFSGTINNLFGPVGPAQSKITTIHSNKTWLIQRPDMAPIAWLFSRSQIAGVNCWDESLTRNDDGELLYRILANVQEVHIIPQLLVFYRREEVMSLSKNLSKESLVSWIKSVKTYKRIVVAQSGEEGKLASDQFFFILYYYCLFKYEDLAIKCRQELYYPDKIYDTEDEFVNKLAKYIGVKNAKRIRMITHKLRGLNYN